MLSVNCHIGNAVWLGIGSKVIEKISIGNRAFIGAGSVVVKNIPENRLAYGVPCKESKKTLIRFNIVSNTPPILRKQRDSNLELYRIVVMLLIVAHHYVVNSGVLESINANLWGAKSLFYLLFGAWGKTGINCFVLITGYYMC